MGAVSLAAWERFYGRVVTQGGDWPRTLWFAAVDDGLAGALPQGSRLLATYRQHIAELTQLERAATGFHQDAQRIAHLEAEIMRLIGHTDKAVRERAAAANQHVELADSAIDRAVERRPSPSGPRRDGSMVWLGALTVGVILFCGVLLGATYYQNQKMVERMERELVALQQRLIEQGADQRAALEDGVRYADGVKRDLGELQAELRANVAEFDQVMSQSVQSMTALSDRAVDELERRLAQRNGDIEVALDGLRERAATLTRGFDQADQALAMLTGQVPDLDSGTERLAEQLQTSEASLELVAGQVDTIKAQVPEVALLLEGQRRGLAEKLAGQRQSVAELEREIVTLKGTLDESRGALATFQATLEQDLGRAKQQSDAIAQALKEVRATQLQATALRTNVETQVEAMQSGLQEKIDSTLSDLAETADLAVLRSEEVIKRADAEAARRLDAATAQAIEELASAREQRLSELGQWVAATQTELTQTHAGLIAGWRGMDEAVAERQASVLADLDQYAATLEGRVKELLDALDVIVTRSNG